MNMHCNLAPNMTVNLNAYINQNNFVSAKFRLSGSKSCKVIMKHDFLGWHLIKMCEEACSTWAITI